MYKLAASHSRYRYDISEIVYQLSELDTSLWPLSDLSHSSPFLTRLRILVVVACSVVTTLDLFLFDPSQPCRATKIPLKLGPGQF